MNMKAKMIRPGTLYRPMLLNRLRDPRYAAEYLSAVVAAGDPPAILIALRDVTDASGGVAALAKKTGLSRETLYRTLSAHGNPRLDTLTVMLEAFGLRLAVAKAA